jgi:hypothetical protein
MPLTPSLRHAVEPFEDRVVQTLLKYLPDDGYVANNVLLPNCAFRCYPDEHDALLLLPWAGYTLEAKNWEGQFDFPGNNPAQWKQLHPRKANKKGRWHVMADRPNPFHVGKQKASILYGYCGKVGLRGYPVHPLIVLPDGSTFTPDYQEYDPEDGSGPRLHIRVVNLGGLLDVLRKDREQATQSFGLDRLAEMLRRLGAEPREDFEGLALCGFRLLRHLDRTEPGCPVVLTAYEAVHDFTETPAEVRLYRNWPLSEQTKRFLEHASRRAAALYRCRVPTVVRLYNAAQMPELLLLAFEHFPGETVLELVRRRGPLPEPLVAGLLGHLARTAEALHRHGIVHLDIRPEYVLVAPGLEEHRGAEHRLTGLTNPLIDSGTLTTEAFGNNFEGSFASVEMREHKHPGRGKSPTDVFSLARLAAYCLLGENKYREAVEASSREPVAFDLSAAGASLRGVLQRAMEYRPENRFSGPGEMPGALGLA